MTDYRRMLRDAEEVAAARESRRLDRQFKVTCIGFLIAGVLLLISGSPIDGIG